MARTATIYKRKRLNVWVLDNQARDIEKLKEKTGKTTTDIVGEALAFYLNKMQDCGVL